MATEDKLREYLKKATTDLARTRRRLAELEERAGEPIAIVGMACRYPDADGVGPFWELVRDGRDAVRDVPPERFRIEPYEERYGVYTRRGAFLDDIAGWDAELFGMSPQEALRTDPQHRLLMELVWEALEDAGTPADRLAGSRTGVMIGLFDTFQYGRLQTERQGTIAFTDPYLVQGSSPSVAAGRLAYHFDLRGPTLTVDTACSSSLVSVHLAAQSLRRDECELAVAGGVSLAMIQPDTSFVYACASSMLSPDGECRTFDAGASGYVMGEGGGIVVLERLSSALRNGHRVHAVLRGSAVNQDGHSNGLTAPNRAAQAAVIRQALRDADVRPEEVAYVEAHGSATRLGDAIELGALHDVFKGRSPERPLAVGAVKTNIGHTLSAAGVAGLIKTVLVLKHGFVPPNLNQREPAEAVPADGTVRPAVEAHPLPDDGGRRIAGVSSFGWSGTNAHIVLEAAATAAPEAAAGASDPAGGTATVTGTGTAASSVPAAPAAGGSVPGGTAEADADADTGDGDDSGPLPRLLPVSAAGSAALRARLADLAELLGDPGAPRLADVAHTLREGRSAQEFRRAVVAHSAEEAATLLSGAAGEPGVRRVKGRPRLAFLLPGTGDQYAGLGRRLYRTEPVFAEAVDRCLAVADACGVDLRPALFPAEESPAEAALDLAALLGRTSAPAEPQADPLHHAEVAHPFLFTVEYALAALLRHRGVTPDVLIGYSLGEYVAACLAGVFTLEDALRIVVERARLIEAAEPGHMLAVSVDETRVRAALAACGASVDVAALNGPQMTVLSGRPDEIETVRRHLDAGGVACRLLRSAHAFHSTLLEPARDKLQALIASVPRDAPAVTIVSNLTGRRLTAEQAVDPAYWAEHLCRPVRFADGVAEIGRLGVDACVELGAGQTLGGLVRQNGGERAPAVFGTLPAPWPAQNRKDERLALLETCGRLWEVGVDLAWPALREPGAALTDLPRYPFQRTRFWPEPPAAGTADPLQETGSAPADLCYAPAWQQDIAPGILPPALDGPLLILDSTAVPGPPAHGTSTGTPDAAGTPGAALAALAAASGTPVLHVVPGTGDLRHDGPRTTADPARPEHLREVLRTASALGTGPLHIAHLGGLATRGPDGDGEEAALRAAITGGFDTLLRTVRALAELPADRPVRLLTVSAGAVEVTGGDISAPERSLVHGLGRVVRSEHPALAWRGVDLEADPQGAVPDAGAAARALGHELRRGPWTDDGDALTAHRGGRRWLRGFSPVEPADSAAPIWRPDGTYLITGGTRGLGMALARHLVRSGVRRLALLGRTPLSDDGGPAAHRTLADVAELEAAGAEVLLLTADAGEPEQLREALRRCREHFGALHGVVHCAGVPAGGMAARRTPEEAARVLAPKVLAMAPLAELAGPGVPEEERLELLVLYSSSVTVLGGIGEGDYCAANTVLDAYAARLARSAPGTRVLSVAWSPWQHDDWGRDAQDALAGRVRAYRREYGFTDEAGCAFLDRLAAGAQGPVLALRQPLEEARRVWASLSAADAQAAPAAPVGTARFPRPQLRSAYVAPATGLESTIAEVWCAYLGLEQVGAHDPFFELGGNSLIGMSMVAALEKRLGRPVAPALLFEHPTVAAMAAALAGDTAAAPGSPRRSADRTERRRQALGARRAASRG
ncbi:SDR family NAD(P)-dependent oxidoreductase [Streptomyces sp. NPDC006186]|jgi:acyl transferase domain-containing protein|uniref:type I polyketide synthase n=1 Tax=Streptomyces sp. NPDC006186 TaxID=3155248 RepID=UPI0033B1D979